MRVLAVIVSMLIIHLCFSQATCQTATSFSDNVFVVYNPPTNWVELYYTFQAPESSVDFSFTAFSSIQNGTALCPNIDVFYILYDQNCNFIQLNGDGFFNGLTVGSNYVLGYVANCPQSGIGFIQTREDIALPVRLLYFTAEASEQTVKLIWATATEQNCYGFQIDRSTDLSSWTEKAFIGGAGNSQLITNYSYYDLHPIPGINYYRLTQYDVDGRFEVLQVIAIVWDPETPTNPFRLFNILGQRVVD